MINRRYVLGSIAFSTMLAFGPAALAMGARSFSAKEFDAAQAAGKSILIEVHAPWCPVCRAQAPILSRLSSQPKYKDVVRFVIDFDSQKDLLRRFNVHKQSTLISFKGKQESGRSVGDTNAASIEALLAKSI
ncbi:MAG: thioredoxin family protein [Alphaproteobacteria bacterium]|nr:thioredoxin family protein [Alphaproteobacteria bacterium]